MSLFQCENCGSAENTALSNQGFSFVAIYDWSYAPELEGKKLCSACGPEKYSDGVRCRNSGWHGIFKRMRLPMGMFKTNKDGNLEHIENGDTRYGKYEIHY